MTASNGLTGKGIRAPARVPFRRVIRPARLSEGRKDDRGDRRGREALKRTMRVVAVGGLAAAMFGAGAVGIALRGGPSQPAAAPAKPKPAAADAALVVASGSLPDLIASLQARLRAIPGD